MQHVEDLLVLDDLYMDQAYSKVGPQYYSFISSSYGVRGLTLNSCTQFLRLAVLFLIAGYGSCSQNSATQATI